MISELNESALNSKFLFGRSFASKGSVQDTRKSWLAGTCQWCSSRGRLYTVLWASGAENFMIPLEDTTWGRQWQFNKWVHRLKRTLGQLLQRNAVNPFVHSADKELEDGGDKPWFRVKGNYALLLRCGWGLGLLIPTIFIPGNSAYSWTRLCGSSGWMLFIFLRSVASGTEVHTREREGVLYC